MFASVSYNEVQRISYHSFHSDGNDPDPLSLTVCADSQQYIYLCRAVAWSTTNIFQKEIPLT